jgi:hypothetical protein
MSRTFRTTARKTGKDTIASRAYCARGRAKCGTCSDRDFCGRARNGHIRALAAAQQVAEYASA